MDYKLHYNKLIERAKNRKLDCYTESHHIIPSCMNGDNNKDNLVRLTAREHFIAHVLLVKIYPKEYGLIKAVQMMCTSSNNQDRIGNRTYGWLKEKFSLEMRKSQTGEKNSQFGTIWINDTNNDKKIKKDKLSIFLERGWTLGRIKKERLQKLRICSGCGISTRTTKSYCYDCDKIRKDKIEKLNSKETKTRKLKPINEETLNIKLVKDVGIKVSLTGNRYRTGLFECPKCEETFETSIKLARKIKSCGSCK